MGSRKSPGLTAQTAVHLRSTSKLRRAGKYRQLFWELYSRDLKIQDGSEDDGRPEVVFP